MKKCMGFITAWFILGWSLCGAGASSITTGTNITVSDGNASGGFWYGAHENNEVEPGMAIGQAWDLEGFFLDNTSLFMVGGFDFVNGYSGIRSGDIFIDVDMDARYGDIHGSSDGNVTTNNSNGYDFVLDMDFASQTYNLFKIVEQTRVVTSYYKQNQGSNPWRYDSGAHFLGAGFFSYNPEFVVKEANSFFHDNQDHNVVMVDLGLFMELTGMDGEMLFHFTMGCGNDNLMGRGFLPVPNPEPGAMVLLGFGLLGLAGLGRKTINKK